jgi:1-acyl-sn-glycerol-3-phosphate acyltransferase/MFS family permease
VFAARIRFVSLWVSQVARVLADWCLRVTAFLMWHRAAATGGDAWHVATAVFIAPFVLLSPLNGCINNGLPRRWVLVGSAAFALAVVALFAVLPGSWMVCLGVVALGSAIYSPARYAMLPAAALDLKMPLPRVNGWIEMGGATAIVGGAALGWAADADSGTLLAGYVVAVLLALNLLSFLTAFPAAFPSDLRRPEPPARAVAGFFRDGLRIGRERTACGSLLALACFQAIVTAGSGAIVQRTLDRDLSSGLLHALLFVGLGAALGCLTAAGQGHPRRSLGLVPLGATGLLAALAWMIFAPVGGANGLPCFLLGFMGGLINVPLRAAYQAAVPADARGNGMAAMNTTIYVLTTTLSVLLIGLVNAGVLPTPAAQLGALAVLTACAALAAWYQLFPHAVEQLLEIPLTMMYRVRLHGPGRDLLRREGPLLIVANHAAYLDPFWLSKMVPRKVTPMMTSVFYDLPFIRWSMSHIVEAIRVPASRFRREAPELREAVTVLRRGGCVLIFPEAQLRKREDQPLRPFGQGVWRILQEVPQTPVLVCWIEGGWQSFTSYYNGRPMRGKRLDWRRRIDIAVEDPRPLDPGILADQRATRRYLMRTCLACRRYLGLPVLEGEECKTADKNNFV